MPKPTRTKRVSAAQVHAYAAKPEEFAEAAASDRAPSVASKAVERAQRCALVARRVAATAR